MKIEYRRGDLLDTDIQHILHGCNCRGVMGSGVALAIRNRYPQAYQDYLQEYQSHGLLLGNIIISVQEDGRHIYNALTQERYGRDGQVYVSYWAIAETFAKINSFGIDAIALPRIGAGLGGGDWSVISAIIENTLTSVQPVVYDL